MIYPKELPVAIHRPGRRFVEFYVEVELSPEASGRLTDIFKNYHFNPVMAFTISDFYADKQRLRTLLRLYGSYHFS